jgi:hypothetical protein
MKATLERVSCTIGDCEVVVVPRAGADVDGDHRLQEALELERATMQLLGDTAEQIERDLAETLDRSSFALAYAPSGAMVGAVRFMLGGADGVKTMWEVERWGPLPPHPALARPEEVIDAMALSLALDTDRPLAELADVLLGAGRCLAGALFHIGRARTMSGYLHDRFLRHAARIGYPFTPIVPADHPAVDSFTPVVASLAEFDRLVHATRPGTHLAKIRPEYRRLCAAAPTLGIEDW